MARSGGAWSRYFSGKALREPNRRSGCGVDRTAQSALGESGEAESARTSRTFYRGGKVCSRSIARRDSRSEERRVGKECRSQWWREKQEKRDERLMEGG